MEYNVLVTIKESVCSIEADSIEQAKQIVADIWAEQHNMKLTDEEMEEECAEPYGPVAVLLDKFKQANVLFKDPFDGARYAIYQEIAALSYERELTDEECVHIVEGGISVYEAFERSTPTGIGCAIGNRLITILEDNPYADIMAMGNEDFAKAYEGSDWS